MLQISHRLNVILWMVAICRKAGPSHLYRKNCKNFRFHSLIGCVLILSRNIYSPPCRSKRKWMQNPHCDTCYHQWDCICLHYPQHSNQTRQVRTCHKTQHTWSTCPLMFNLMQMSVFSVMLTRGGKDFRVPCWSLVGRSAFKR